jgi:hypothetical protein
MIYFMQPVDGGPVKIGCSANVRARQKQLEAHYGRELALLATMEGDREQETEIHARFADLRLGHTEQFRPAPELMAFIGRPLLVGANPEAVEAMPHAPETKPTAIIIRCSQAWLEWLRRAAKHCRTDAAKLVDAAVADYARRRGFDEKPPER